MKKCIASCLMWLLLSNRLVVTTHAVVPGDYSFEIKGLTLKDTQLVENQVIITTCNYENSVLMPAGLSPNASNTEIGYVARDDSGNILSFGTTMCDAEGKFSFFFAVPLSDNTAQSKDVEIQIGGSKIQSTKYIYRCYNNILVNAALDELKTTNDIEKTLNDGKYIYQALGFLFDDFENNKALTIEIFSAARNQMTIENAAKIFNGSILCSIIKKGMTSEEFAEALIKYDGTVVELKYGSITPANMSADDKTKVFGLLRAWLESTPPLTAYDIETQYHKACALNIINGSTYLQMVSAIEECSELLGLVGTSEYSVFELYSKSDKESITKVLTLQTASSPYSTVDGFLSSFAGAVNNKGKETTQSTVGKSPSGGSTSAGGGISGGSGLGYEISKNEALSETAKTPDTKEESVVEIVFNDLDSVEWAREAIYNLASKGIISGKGDGTFAPMDFTTREEAIKMIVGTFGLKQKDEPVSFTDVFPGAWYYDFVNIAASNKIVQGYEDRRFGVGEVVNREEFSVMVNRTAHLLGITFASTYNKKFDDEDKISDWAKNAVAEMVRAGIINGRENNKFDPSGNITRAEASKILYAVMISAK